MKITTLAYFISGLFCSGMLVGVSATASENFTYSWPTGWSGINGRIPISQAGGPTQNPLKPYGYLRGNPSNYRFRPMMNNRAPTEAIPSDRWQVTRARRHLKPDYPVALQHRLGHAVAPEYRFRSLVPRSQQPIPDSRYVFRPLKPAHNNRQPAPVHDRYPPRPYIPDETMSNARSGYSGNRQIQTYQSSPAKRRVRYVYGYQTNPKWRFRPIMTNDPYQGKRSAWRDNTLHNPGYYQGRSYRPEWDQTYDARHVWYPQPLASNGRFYSMSPSSAYVQRNIAYQHRAYSPGWERSARSTAPGYQVSDRIDEPNRYGVDWYDGHSDDKGAWYQLAQHHEGPGLIQNWSKE
jgi:hypothetical protein